MVAKLLVGANYHWLPICNQVKFKVLGLKYMALCISGQGVLRNCLTAYMPRRPLGSVEELLRQVLA